MSEPAAGSAGSAASGLCINVARMKWPGENGSLWQYYIQFAGYREIPRLAPATEELIPGNMGRNLGRDTLYAGEWALS